VTLFNGIGEGGLNNVLSNRLTVYGQAPAPSVEPALFAGLTLENDRPEWGHLKGERLYARQLSKGAVAAEYGMIQLYIPTTSRAIAVITHIESATANLLGIARLVGISGGLGGWAAYSTCNRDTRENGNGGAVIIESNGNAAFPTNYGRYAQLVQAGQAFTAPIVLHPGGAIAVFSEVLNQTLNANVVYYERQAEAGELV